jgi:hypothetical protein
VEPIHAVEYELTSVLATDIRNKLLRWELRRGWRRDLPLYAGTLVFAALIIGLGIQGWMLPGVGGGLLCLLTLFAFGSVMRRRSHAHVAVGMALLALQTHERRVRVEFDDERVRLEVEFLRGEGAWSELDEIVVFDTFWALQLSNGGCIVVPCSLVSRELEGFLRGKARAVMAAVCEGCGKPI